MKNILESLYDEYGKRNQYIEEKNRISSNRKQLRESLSKYEKKLLLRIVDDYDLIIGKAGTDSFIDGVATGIKLTLEILAIQLPQ